VKRPSDTAACVSSYPVEVVNGIVTVEIAEDPDEDMNVVRSFKRGFMWKGRVMRAEEVAIKKWKEGFLMAMQSEPEKR